VTGAAERLIALEGAVNFRDLGGYATATGMRTRWRTLFRADGLGELTDSDLSVLRTLGIRTVIFMTETTPRNYVDATLGYGAEVVFVRTIGEGFALLDQYAAKGWTPASASVNV